MNSNVKLEDTLHKKALFISSVANWLAFLSFLAQAMKPILMFFVFSLKWVKSTTHQKS